MSGKTAGHEPSSESASDNIATAGEIAFVRTQVQEAIDDLQKASRHNGRRAFCAKIFIVVASSTTTLILGLKSNSLFSENESYFSAAALFLSATIPILTSWDAFFDHHWLWVRFTTAGTGLHAVLDDLNYMTISAAPVAKEKLDTIYSRFRATIEETDSAWRQKRAAIVDGTASKQAP
jgi:hypothetical protein